MVDFRDTKRAFSGLSNVRYVATISESSVCLVIAPRWLVCTAGFATPLPIRWLFEKTIYAIFCGGVSMGDAKTGSENFTVVKLGRFLISVSKVSPVNRILSVSLRRRSRLLHGQSKILESRFVF